MRALTEGARGDAGPLEAKPPKWRLAHVIWRPGAAATLILMLLTVLACGSRILHGGFIADDWALRADAHFTGFAGIMNTLLKLAVRRPIGDLYFATIFTIIGSHIRILLMLSTILHLLLAATVYGFLRVLRFSWFDSVAIAALVLLFPYSDSTWLWASASSPTLAILCVLVGCLLNVRAMDAESRSRVLLRIAGLALVAMGILIYELVAMIGLASGSLYLMRTNSRRGLREWGIDAIVIAAVLAVFTFQIIPILHGSDTHEVLSIAQMWEHAYVIFSQSATLLTRSFVPFGTPDNLIVLGTFGVLVLLVLLRISMLSRGDPTRRSLIKWLTLAGVGVLWIGLGYIVLVPANIYYVPLQAGVGNRINSVAAIGYALVVYATVQLVGVLVSRAFPYSRRLIDALAVLAVGVIGLGYTNRVDADKTAWNQAGVLSRAILATLHQRVPTPAQGTSIVVFNAPIETSPGVPVFDSSWDLNGAVQLLWNDPTLKAYPIMPGMMATCAARQLFVNISGGQPSWHAAYPVDLVNIAASRVFSIKSQPICVDATKSLASR